MVSSISNTDQDSKDENLIRPSKNGRYGRFGGQYVPETLMPALFELEKASKDAWNDSSFVQELNHLLKTYVGRETPLYEAKRLTQYFENNGVRSRIWLKREDLNHTGAHKINNALGQALLAIRMGKKRIIAETGAGQHGVATATVCALFGMECIIYMGQKDIERQKPNVIKMKLLGAKIIPVSAGSASLKDAMNEALRDWVSNVGDTFYIIGTAAGPHPYPMMVRDFQSIIGKEVRKQILKEENKLPNTLIACVGGGSNALGLFYNFLDDKNVSIYGIEAGGVGINSGKHAASLAAGKPGILHGNRTYLIQNKEGQIKEAHSISAGLDYPGIGPEHSWLKDIGRVKYVSVNDRDALSAFKLCSRLEGIIPALEPAHALHFVTKYAPKQSKNHIIVMNMCGRGDKDMEAISHLLDLENAD